MTRKKSNVKALALAVTCAILAGGGIGLEPVYAADVTLSLTNGAITAGSVIGTINGTVGGTAIADGTITDGSLTNGKFSGTVTLTGDDIKTAIESVDISKAKVGSDATSGTIESLVKNVGDNSNAIQAVNGQVTNLDSKVEAYNTNLNTKITEQVSTLDAKINTKVNASDFSAYQVKNDNAVDTLKYNTQKIEFKKDNMNTSDDATYIEGITHAGDVRLANGDVRAKSIVLEEEFANGTFAQATLTREAIVNLNGMTDGKTKIQVADGSEVGGVTFVQGKVTNVVSINDNLKFESDGIYLNKGDQTKQIKIDNDGKIIIGTSSSAYDTDGFYAGGDDYGAAKAGIKSDGSLKATGFTVDGATGNTTIGGDLTVAGAASFAKATTFAGGIKTDKISEKTEGQGVTVDGVVLKDGGITATGNVTTTGDINGKDITATGALNGKTLGIGTNGSEFYVDANGAVKAAGGKVEIDKDGNAQFGAVANNRTTIAGKLATFGENTTTDYTTINGGKLDTYNLTVRNDMNVNNFKAKNITSENRITVGDTANGVYLDANGTLSLGTETNQNLGKTQLANINDTIKSGKVIDATSATIGGVEINGGNVTTATGTIKGKTISDGAGATLTSGKITAKEGQIGGVTISAAGVVTGVSEIKANTFKVDDNNFLDGNGITAKGGKIGGAVIDATTLTVGVTKLDSTEGITTNKLKIGDMVLTGKGLNTGANDFQVNGVTFNQGKVTAQAEKGFVAGTSSFKQDSLIVDANNKLEATNGLTTEKATVNGTLDVTGKATFGTAGKQTTIDGDAITTDTLKANKLILGASGNATVEVDKDGSLKAANGKFAVDKDGALKAANGAFNVDKDGKTTFTKDADNLSSINGGNIWAKATDAANHTSSELQHDSTGLHVSGTHAGKTSAFAFDAATGISTFTGQDNSTVTINGSAIRSAKSDGTAGRLDGENLTLYKDANNQTTMSAGKATFKSDNAGKYNGKETTIDGGVITTDTLNVQRINLGKEMVNSDGTTTAVSNLSIDEHGNIKAAGGNFTVAGTDQGNNKGALHNEVGNTSFNTTVDGASMKFDNTAAAGGVTSEVAVEANKATVAAGEKASFVATTDNGGTATITGGTQTVTTTDKGTVFENSAHKTAFVDNGATNTIINGNEITTGKITTDQLVITGKGNADGNGGSIAFGGNGTIKSDINDGTANGKNTSFETTLDGVNTKVTDGTTTTENKVTAEGNSNTVKQDDTHKSEFNQGLTSIGGVVTNGEIKVAQKLDGATGLLTNEVTNADGKWSKLEQSGTGLTYTDSANAGNATRIDSSDVSIGSATEPDKRINLSDLGQIDELDKEIRDNEVYKSNETAVGGINAEAAIRRGEVERLDNRISEEVTRLDGRINDVNDRVNKVGAMAAAIASLKSIGYDPQAPSEFSIGLGQYKGETGVGMGFFHYPNKNFMINVSLSTAGGETMGGIGATWRFGHKSPQKLLEEQREEQAKKELAAAEKYQAAAKLAKEAQERAEYAAKLARQAQVSADNAKAAADATQAKHFG
ncbi:YadA-like family protein [Phascolarctobacterium succinatutens]|uniref:YadA-like family protein n=3 Tax=Phascolarctobacterium succinatutens TaxID=626940 RepID=UPI003AF0B11A